SDADAEETKNDALFEIWKRIPPDQPENLRAYVASVCRSKALDRIRYAEAKKRDRNVTETLGELAEPTEGFENEAVDSMAIKEIVNAFLGELSARDRQIFMKRYYLFQPIPSIASSLGVSNELVKSSLFRMRNKLKKELERGLK
ncbi:MAG: sigma-70 family RNA polymerase sigma factor, partial [Clostridia bacterium]|nr:sigma-70 family RNA polymerase sigma factor [Clostridia bacterium]